MVDVNPKRGELEIVLGSEKLKGKLTLDTIMRVESAVGVGIIEITRKLSEGILTLTEIISILTPVIRAGGNDVDEKEVGKIIYKAGYRAAMTEAGKVLMSILSAGDDEGNGEETEAA